MPRRAAAASALAVLALLLLAAVMPAAETVMNHGVPYEGRGHMNRVLATIDLPGGLHWTITGWKILGFLGAFCFAGRWIVQWLHRKRTGLREMPTAFWVISLFGAASLTMYFIWGKNDSVGILTNALPASVALYNLIQDLKHKHGAKPA